MVQLSKYFTLVFWPYLSNAVELRDGSCAKNDPLNMAITATPTMACNDENYDFQYPGTSILPLIVLYWMFCLQVLALLQYIFDGSLYYLA